MFLKNIFLLVKYIYKILLFILIFISLYVLITKNSPVDFVKNYSKTVSKPRELVITNSEYNKETKSLIVPEGVFEILTYKKDIGTQYGQSGNKDLLVITYKFTATQDNVKPFKIWKKYIYATQDGRNLSDGMLRLADSDNPSAKEDVEKMNNSVSFFKTGESREIIQVYFIDKNKEIDLNYPKYTEKIKL